jgi:ribonuclease HI
MEGGICEVARLKIYTDGCSKGNPGPAGIGVVIYKEGEREPVFKVSDEIGIKTNNQAEYKALIRALEYAVLLKAEDVEVNSDSELMVKQMNGNYRVKNAGIKPLYAEARRLAGLIKKFSIRYIPRENNRGADKLANMGLGSF